jgi:glycosyltransferase involved in cell wall biosynthesis
MNDYIYFVANKSTKTIGGVQTIMRLIEQSLPNKKFIELPIFDNENDHYYNLLANVKVITPLTRIKKFVASTFNELFDNKHGNFINHGSKIVVFGVQKLFLIPEDILAKNEVIIFQSTRPDLTFGFPNISEVPLILMNKVKHIDKFVCFTKQDKAIINGIINNSDIEVNISWFVIPNPSKTKREQISKYSKNIMYLGRFDFFQKNILEYVEVHKKIEDKFTLNMYGYGPAETILKASGANVLGKIDDISEVAEKNSILLLLSSSEGFGNVLIEAMSVGMPVIVYDSYPAAKSIVTKGVGKLIPFGQTDLVIKSVEEILKDEKTYEKFSNKAYQASKLYEKNIIVNKYKEALNA